MEQTVLVGDSGSVHVVRTLYGPCGPERLASEQRDVQRRAEQLNTRDWQARPMERALTAREMREY